MDRTIFLHLERVRDRLRMAGISSYSVTVNHGDFIAKNLLFQEETLSGVLDFDSVHFDLRGADVACARRSRHDEVVWGYLEIAPLTDAELECLDDLWRATVLRYALQVLRGDRAADRHEFELQWCVDKLRRRSRSIASPGMNEQNSMDSTEIVPARDGEEFTFRVNGGEWIVAWHPASKVPEGTPHGASAICLTPDGGLVLISTDGERWGLPGGRPEKEESWVQTLHREVLEEACAKVVRARLLGFTQGRCGAGLEEGLVLVRSLWRAEVELAPWMPQFGIAHRRVIPADAWAAHLWIDAGFAAIFWRAFAEAGLARQHL